jgi:cytochrome b involved in lipid metabolism
MVPLFVVAGVVLALVLIALVAFAARSSTCEVANTKKRELGRFSAADVAPHNTRDDLWVILRLNGEAKVYDVTSYVDEHPGGDAILTNAGGDSTEPFTGPQHPPRVMDTIDDFCIGYLIES